MLPAFVQGPAALVLLTVGALSCFAGYRLFRTVLAVYGAIFGAFIGGSLMGSADTTTVLIAAIVGAIVGGVIMVAAYFVGVALVGAGLGAALIHAAWRPWGDPHPIGVIVAALIGAGAGLVLQKYVVVLATAFGGALTLVHGALALNAARPGGVPRSSAVWLLYPFNPAPDQPWALAAWLALGALGTFVQLHGGSRRRTT